jgi:protein-tyrosine phosphatase
MAPVVIDVRRAEDGRDVVHRAVQALVEGELVVFPTETVYGIAASALDADAVQKLLQVKGRATGHALSLAVRSANAAWDYVPRPAVIAQRLARRCWPGPLTLILPNSSRDSLVQQLPESVQQAVCPSGLIGLRVPAHPLILDVLDMVAGPLALTSANRSGEPDPVTVEDAVNSLRGQVRLFLDDGPCRFGQPSTVLLIQNDGIRILREGVVTRSALRRLASFVVVVVCTGNTCRSPMAEAMMRAQLAERYGCSVAELEGRGIVVLSAGSAAMDGTPAAPSAVEVMRARGLDLGNHTSQPLSDHLVREADVILTMTQGHRASILASWPTVADRTFLISPDDDNVSDPIGGPLELYEKCADQISHAISRRIATWDLERQLPKFLRDSS